MTKPYKWDEVEDSIRTFAKLYDRVMSWKRLRTDEEVLETLRDPDSLSFIQNFVYGDEGTAPASPANPVGQWLIINKGRDWYRKNHRGLRTLVRDNFDPLHRFLKNPEKWGDYLLRAVKACISGLEDYASLVTLPLREVAPEKFTYSGFKIENPDRFSDELVRKTLAGIDYMLALFKKRGVEPLLREGVKKIVLEYSGEGTAHGHHYTKERMIKLYPNKILATQGTRILEEWVDEVFVHEFGHNVHLVYLHPEARREWDSGWAPVEEARRKREESLHVTNLDRQRFFDLIETMGWNPNKAGTRLNGLDRLKYLAWLNSSGLTSTPNQVRLNGRGKMLFNALQNPKKELEREWGKDWFSEEDLPDAIDRQIKQTLHILKGDLALDYDGPFPSLSGDEAEKFLGEDKSVNEAIEALQAPTWYAKTDEKEDFAETFTAFMGNPGMLSDNAKTRMQRALWMSGFYGKPVMRVARARRLVVRYLQAAKGSTKYERDPVVWNAIGMVGDWGFGQGYGDVRHFGTEGYETGKIKQDFLTMLDDWIWEWGSSSDRPLPKDIQKLIKVLRYQKEAQDTLDGAREERG